MPVTTALVDGDIVLYSCGFAAEKVHWRISPEAVGVGKTVGPFLYKKDIVAYCEDNGIPQEAIKRHVEVEPIQYALHTVKMFLKNVKELIEKEFRNECTLRVFLTGKGNFRNSVATTAVYKGNRDVLHKPVYYDQIRQYLIDRWDAEVVDGMEADDAIAINQNSSTIIVTKDKDLNMVEGWHLSMHTKEFFNVSPEDAVASFWKQMLTGDCTDNIKGIRGIGKKKAQAVIDSCVDIPSVICRVGMMYAVAFDDPEARMNENGKLLWMKRTAYDDWNIERIVNDREEEEGA